MGLKRANNFTSLLQLFSLVVVIATGRLRQIHGPRNVLERSASGFRSTRLVHFMLFVSVRMLIRTGDLTMLLWPIWISVISWPVACLASVFQMCLRQRGHNRVDRNKASLV